MKISIENIKWLTIIGLIIYIILLQQCSKPCRDTQSIIHTTDTVRTSHIDTVEFIKTVPKYIHIKVTEPQIVYIDTSTGDTLSTYNEIYQDSLIEGLITSTVKGKLINQTLQYTPLFPKYIIKTDSIFITNTNTITQENKLALFIGGEIGGNLQAFNISPVVTIATKKGYNYSYRYGILDKTHNIGMSIKLSFKQK